MGKASAMPSGDDEPAKVLTSADVDKRLEKLFEANDKRFCAQQAAIFSDFQEAREGNLL